MKKLYIISLFLFFSHAIVSQNNSQLDYAYSQEVSQENNELKQRISLLPKEAININFLIAQSIRKKDYYEAMKYANQLDSVVPNNPDVKNFKGKLFIILKDNSNALFSFEEAIKLNPNNKWFHINYVGLLFENNEFDKALNAINNLITLFPNWSIGYNLKGGILQSLNRDEEALVIYKKAVKCEPKSALIYTNKGDLNSKLNNKNQAILDYKNALEIQPDYKLASDRLNSNL
ncbi:MAG: tetratricopeptide repeat protein [Flavobacterium sp.]|nr:tetratricopeptide repeat protein [Flavobacterium sp.]